MSSTTDDTHVALLRGINVGGRNKLPMKALAAIFEKAGCRDVRTYIQSGNVVYRAAPEVVERVPKHVSEAIETAFGFAIPIVTRSAAQLTTAVRSNPFLARDPDCDPKTLHVGFLLDTPTTEQVAALDPGRDPVSSFVVVGEEIFLHFPEGLARTKLTNAYFDRALGTVCTVRNWRTVGRLAEMATERIAAPR